MIGAPSSRPLFRFHVAGVPVDVDAMFLAVLAIGGMGSGDAVHAAAWIACAGTGILWHELGHAVVVRWLGYEPAIALYAMGGVTQWAPEERPTPRQGLAVSAAGPIAGLLLGAAVWTASRLLGPFGPTGELVVRMALWVNVGWSLFNLLPILPLDGGHVLDHLAELLTRRAHPRWVGWVSAVVGTGVALAGLYRQSVWIAILGALGASYGYARVRGRPGARRADPVAAARRASARGAHADVVAALLPEARVGRLETPELALLVEALVALERTETLVELCRDRLGTFHRGDDAAPLARLASEALVDAGADVDALAVVELAFRQLRVPHDAYDAATILLRLGDRDDAVRWLERAVDAGLQCEDVLRTDPAFDPVRGRDDFRALLARARARPA